MSRDPAFLFYPGDFLTGVSDLTMEERGQYITLLCLHHQKGRLTDKILKVSGVNATADVMAKFVKDESGLYYNKRLEKEMLKRSEFTGKQRQRAIEGWKKRKATADATALPKKEDRNRNENKDKALIENIVYPFDSEKFTSIWNHWKEYKSREFGFKYKSKQSEQAALSKLSKLSNNEGEAVMIIVQSMENGWKGFFELKNKSKNSVHIEDIYELAKEKYGD